MVTPLNSQMELDIPGLEKLVEHLVSGGVHALFLLGSNGEAPSLSHEIQKELISRTCELVDNRIPVLVGVSDTCMTRTIEIAGFARDEGAGGVVVAPPYYYPLSGEEVINYYESLSRKLPLPFLIYNLPSHTKINLTVEAVKRIREMGAVGIKDSSGDMLNLYSLIEAFRDSPEFSVITGTEIFLPATILHGGHGAIAGGANLFPELFVNLYEASVAGDLKAITKHRRKVMMLYQTIYRVGKHASRYLKGTKCGLSVMGICEDHIAPPLQRFEPDEREEVKKYMEHLSLMQ